MASVSVSFLNIAQTTASVKVTWSHDIANGYVGFWMSTSSSVGYSTYDIREMIVATPQSSNYTWNISSLSPGTKYYVKPVLLGSSGWMEIYLEGTTGNFTTIGGAPTGLNVSDGTYTDKVYITWTNPSGVTNNRVYRNTVNDIWSATQLYSGSAITSYSDTGAATGTITAGSVSASDGTSTSQVTGSTGGNSTNNGTTYYYWVGAYYGSGSWYYTSDTGYRGVGSLTYSWYGRDIWLGQYGTTFTDTGAPAAVISSGQATASQGTYADKIVLTLNNQSITPQIVSYKCYLSATDATSVWTSSDNGYRGAPSLTYQWQVSTNGSSYSDISGGTTTTYDYTGATPGTVTYFKCVVSASGCTSQTTAATTGYTRRTAQKFVMYI